MAGFELDKARVESLSSGTSANEQMVWHASSSDGSLRKLGEPVLVLHHAERQGIESAVERFCVQEAGALPEHASRLGHLNGGVIEFDRVPPTSGGHRRWSRHPTPRHHTSEPAHGLPLEPACMDRRTTRCLPGANSAGCSTPDQKRLRVVVDRLSNGSSGGPTDHGRGYSGRIPARVG